MHDLADSGSGAPHDPYRVPAYATDLGALPQAIVVTRRMRSDPRTGVSDTQSRLRDARVQVNVTRYPGAYHGFLMRSDATARGRLAIAEVCALLRAKFDNPVNSRSRSPDTLAPPDRPVRPTIKPTDCQ